MKITNDDYVILRELQKNGYHFICRDPLLNKVQAVKSYDDYIAMRNCKDNILDLEPTTFFKELKRSDGLVDIETLTGGK